MRIFFVFLLLLSGCGLFSKRGKSQEYARLHLHIGTSLLSQGNFPGALKELLEAEKLDPSNPLIQNNLGIAYFARKDLLLAERHFLRALELDPKYSEARSNYGTLLIEKKDFKSALTNFKLVTEDLVYPFPERAWMQVGIAYFHLKNYPLAKENFLKSIDINRNYCPAWTYLGRTLIEEKKLRQAAQRLDQAVAICQKADAYESDFYSAVAYAQLGNREQAVARLENIIANDPSGIYAEKSRQLLKSIEKKGLDNETDRSTTPRN